MTTDPAGRRIELRHDVDWFLATAAPLLAAQPVLSNVVASVAARASRDLAEGRHPPAEDWWAVVRDPGGPGGPGGPVVGAAMRTAPGPRRPPYVLAVPDETARTLARLLHERGEDLTAANGALPAARVLLEEVARLVGGRVEVLQRTRLHEVVEVVAPRPVPGRLRPAGPDEAGLCARWWAAFGDDADEQSGRPRGTGFRDRPGTDEVRRRIEAGLVWVWEVGGEVVHLVVTRPPAHGVATIGPVYTPAPHRGRGYAAAAVAEVSRRLLAGGTTPCLFTDLANPTSNRLYAALGYRPVADLANLVRVTGPVTGLVTGPVTEAVTGA